MVYDIVVVGGGPAGTEAALMAAQAGLRVALVSDMALGGRATWGSLVPSKIWLEETHRALLCGREHFSLPHLREKIRIQSHQVARDTRAQLESVGVALYDGKAEITSAGVVALFPESGGTRTLVLQAHYIVLATGSEPIFTPDLKPEPPYIIAPRLAGSMEALPSRLLMIGGGVTGVEYASAFAALGVEVMLLQKGARLLPRIDAEMVRVFENWLTTALPIQVIKDAAVSSLSVEDGQVAAHLEGRKRYWGSHGFIAAGRRADVSCWKSEEMLLSLTPDGAVKVDEFCRTSVPNVYAAGDVTGVPMTVNHAQMQARVAVGHILNEAEPVMKPLVEAVYTYLPIGQLGDTAESEDGLLITKPYSGLLKAQMEDATNGLLKVKIDKHSGRILGAAAFGPNAIELLSLLQIAMHAGITWKALRQYPLPHPTYSELLSKL